METGTRMAGIDVLNLCADDILGDCAGFGEERFKRIRRWMHRVRSESIRTRMKPTRGSPTSSSLAFADPIIIRRGWNATGIVQGG